MPHATRHPHVKPYVSGPLKPQGRNGEVLYAYADSDHYPVTSELAILEDDRLLPPTATNRSEQDY